MVPAMRAWHRWIGSVFGVFLLLAGASGVWLEFDELFGVKAKVASPFREGAPRVSSDIAMPDLAAKIEHARQVVFKAHGGLPVGRIDVDFRKQPPIVAFWLASGNRVLVDSETFEIRAEQKVGKSWLLKLHTDNFTFGAS